MSDTTTIDDLAAADRLILHARRALQRDRLRYPTPTPSPYRAGLLDALNHARALRAQLERTRP